MAFGERCFAFFCRHSEKGELILVAHPPARSQTYEWGLWSYCATNGDLGAPRSYCVASSVNNGVDPAAVLLEDVPLKYSDLLKSILPSQVFSVSDCELARNGFDGDGDVY